MTTIEILGASGFGLSLAHICWQVWWQHRQNRERVRGEVSVGAKPCVKVHNTGAMPVHLTGVQLIVKQDGASQEYPFQKVIVRQALPTAAGRLGEEQWQFVGRRTYDEPLPRGGAYIFALPKEAAPLQELVTKADRLKMWISVCSNAGEICRLKQKQTLVYLKKLVEVGN